MIARTRKATRSVLLAVAFLIFVALALALAACGRRDDGMGSLYKGIQCKTERTC